ncbi:hypothetical protein [Nocardioides sp. LS1]|uniref:hypothetical protein n=1 Tax=Nocardioides sp. LS1 TaxID=1027620 RepID=UPI000F61C053|nr:hypothetical protein [Nocardioides sp. LS1]GCD91400.1 hypothetical protein NLS1_34060 [Nocardioides sp. LS1]
MPTYARTTVRLLVLLLAVAGLTVPAASALADDLAPPVVTWPEVTSFNPDHTPYVVTVDDSANDPATDTTVLVASWNGHTQQLADQGGTTIEFLPTDQDGTYIAVQRCAADLTSCSDTVADTTVWLVRKLTVTVGSQNDVGPGPQDAWLDSSPVSPDSVEWQLLDTTTSPTTVASQGTSPVSGNHFDYSVPTTGFDEHDLRLSVTAVSDTDQYGHLEGTSLFRPVTPHTRPPGVRLELDSPALYWAQDGYADEVRITIRSGTGQRLRLDVVAPDGTVLRLPARHTIRRVDREVFSGSDGDGGHLPNGVYTVRATVVDYWGNVAEASAPLKISDRHAVWKTWTHTYTAQRALVRENPGACSTISHHPSYGWKGGLGLYSQTTCKRTAQSFAIAVNAVPLPTAVAYDKLRVSVYGGAPRGTTHPYVVLGYYRSKDGSFVDRAQFDGALGTHRGLVAGNRVVWGVADSEPTFYWSLGLDEGSRWEVRDYTVSARIQVLR